MIPVLKSCESIIGLSAVKLNREACRSVASKIYEEILNKKLSFSIFSDVTVHPKYKNVTAIDWIFVVDTLNFCFWVPGEKHWTVTWNGEQFTGYYALCASVNRAIENGVDLTKPEVYSKLSLDEVKYILRGDNGVELQLLNERQQCLQESGNILLQHFQGSFANCVKDCNRSAQNLLQTIISYFPSFRDEAIYNNIPVGFYKRAQILIGDIWSWFNGADIGEFTDIDTITMFADYRVPQVLHYFKVLEYPDRLLSTLTEGKLLENGCKEEVEIRAASIVAVDIINTLVVDLLTKSSISSPCNPILIDQYLWTYRRKNNEKLESVPFHKTISIYY